jgi:hypothetical protein
MNYPVMVGDVIQVLFVLILGTAALIITQRSLVSLFNIYAAQSLILAIMALVLFGTWNIESAIDGIAHRSGESGAHSALLAQKPCQAASEKRSAVLLSDPVYIDTDQRHSNAGGLFLFYQSDWNHVQ